MDERMREAKRLPYGMDEAKGDKRMDDVQFKMLVNKVAEACKKCRSEEIDCEGCPYKVKVGCVPEKAKDTLDVLQEYQERTEAQKSTQPLGIKGKRDEALLNLYKHYNRLTALEDIDYTTLESMHILIDSIEKLEHARHMEASDEIAKMAIEKLEKFARPMPEIKMDVKQFEEIAKDHYGKKGAKNDD